MSRPIIRDIAGHRLRVDYVGVLDANRYRRPSRAPSRYQIHLAAQWLERCEQIKTPSLPSYIAKHAAERWLRSCGRDGWISNGALIVAAYRQGIRQRANLVDVNTMLALSLQSYGDLPESLFYPACSMENQL